MVIIVEGNTITLSFDHINSNGEVTTENIETVGYLYNTFTVLRGYKNNIEDIITTPLYNFVTDGNKEMIVYEQIEGVKYPSFNSTERRFTAELKEDDISSQRSISWYRWGDKIMVTLNGRSRTFANIVSIEYDPYWDELTITTTTGSWSIDGRSGRYFQFDNNGDQIDEGNDWN